ncbi:MAG TPA: hypothetical protein VMU95_22805 [Trebonia sp.]|nr:hypothetical protein [Trebonia sp.]
MKRISRIIVGAAASAALLGGIGGAALTVVPAVAGVTATSTPPICNPTAIEYGTGVWCPTT